VQVDHHAWHQQLIRMRQDLIKALNQACGKTAVMDVQFIYCASHDARSRISDSSSANPLSPL
ncbi:MAG: hypothetical protein WBN92_00380, partial [Terriglobia bacterium]